MNKHKQKPTDMFNKQDVNVYLTVTSCLLNISVGFCLCLFKYILPLEIYINIILHFLNIKLRETLNFHFFSKCYCQTLFSVFPMFPVFIGKIVILRKTVK